MNRYSCNDCGYIMKESEIATYHLEDHCPICSSKSMTKLKNEDMSNTKHTKGPWLRIEKAEHRANTKRWVAPVMNADNTKIISKVFGDTKEETEANAKLIAASPEMLEALQAVVREMNLDGTACAAKVHAAINKATS